MKKHNIVAYICTKGRYDTSLSQAMLSVALQSRVPDVFYLWDDNAESERKDLREIPIYQYIFQLFDIKGIKWSVFFGGGKGQHFGHQAVQKMAPKDSLCMRVDDDCVLEFSVIENLEAQFTDDKVGAVGCSILTPPLNKYENSSSDLDNLYAPNEQWSIVPVTKSVQSLHCSYMYKANIADFDLRLSKVAFREESLHSGQIFFNGYKVLITPGIIWHFKNKNGGIRSEENRKNYEHDSAIFTDWLTFNKVNKDQFLVVIDAGYGDHLVFKKDIYPRLKAKHKNLILAVCHPQLFPNEKCISIAEASKITDMDKHNIYKLGVDTGHKGSLSSLYERLYLQEKR